MAVTCTAAEHRRPTRISTLAAILWARAVTALADTCLRTMTGR